MSAAPFHTPKRITRWEAFKILMPSKEAMLIAAFFAGIVGIVSTGWYTAFKDGLEEGHHKACINDYPVEKWCTHDELVVQYRTTNDLDWSARFPKYRCK